MSQHKLLQSNRPKQLMTKALIFKNNLTRKTSNGAQTPLLDSTTKLHLKLHNNQLNEPQQRKHRLKLKDYLKLNELSRSKHSIKSRSKQSYISHQSSTSILTSHNFRQTFGPQGKIGINIVQQRTVKKRSVNNQQQLIESIDAVQEQLLKSSEKAIDKLNSLQNLIRVTNGQNKNYQDLVFVCRIQEMIEQKLLNGIQQINKLFVDHFKAKKQQSQICLNVKSLLKIDDQKQFIPSPIKLRRQASIREKDNQKTIKKI